MKIIDSKIVDSGFEDFNKLDILKRNLGYEAMRTLSSNTKKECVYDYSLNKRVDRGTMLAVALALREYILKNFAKYDRIGIALPSCMPGVAVNLAVQMAGKVSVNLNFTMGAEAERACLELGQSPRKGQRALARLSVDGQLFRHRKDSQENRQKADCRKAYRCQDAAVLVAFAHI